MSKYLSISLTIAIIFVFGYTLFHDSLNIPSFDDYDATLGFIKHFYFENLAASQKFETLFSRHNEHRILFSRIVSACYYGIFREINFTHLVIFQNIFLLGFFGLILTLVNTEKKLYPEVLLITTAFLFSFSFWQVSFYYWAGIQHYVVFFFSFASLMLLSRTGPAFNLNFLWAILSALLAVLSFGNGFLVLFLGAFLLFAHRKYTQLSVWSLISLALLVLTFFVQKPNPMVGDVPFNPEWMARLLFTFLGSFLYINPGSGQSVNIIVCMIAGAGILLFWVFLFFSGYAFKKPMLFCLFSLPVLTGIIISISRFEAKAAGGIAPRYMFFTATIPVLLLVILLDLQILKKEYLKYLSVPVILIWGFIFYNDSRALKNSNQEIVATVEKWKNNDTTRLVYYQEPKNYTDILHWAISHQVVRNRIYLRTTPGTAR